MTDTLLFSVRGLVVVAAVWATGYLCGYYTDVIRDRVEKRLQMSAFGGRVLRGVKYVKRQIVMTDTKSWINVMLFVAVGLLGWLAFDARQQVDVQDQCTREYLTADRTARDTRSAAVELRDEKLKEVQIAYGDLLDVIPDFLAGVPGSAEPFAAALEKNRTASQALDTAQADLDKKRMDNEFPPYPDDYCEE